MTRPRPRRACHRPRSAKPRALGTTIDPQHDLRSGDRFYLRWEQAFALDGQPTGDGRLIWAELRTKAKGTIVLHRLRLRDGDEQIFLASGVGAASPKIRMPLATMQVTSGYGLRPDPLDQPVILEPPPPAAPAPTSIACASRSRPRSANASSSSWPTKPWRCRSARRCTRSDRRQRFTSLGYITASPCVAM
jgi:hypothetical protein